MPFLLHPLVSPAHSFLLDTWYLIHAIPRQLLECHEKEPPVSFEALPVCKVGLRASTLSVVATEENSQPALWLKGDTFHPVALYFG